MTEGGLSGGGDQEAKLGRLPWLRPTDLGDEARDVYLRIAEGPRGRNTDFQLTDSQGRLHGPFNALLFAPKIGQALQELGSVIRFSTHLPGRSRELAILTVSVIRACDFEWYAHRAVGLAEGLSESEIRALIRGEVSGTMDATERLVHRLVYAMLTVRDLNGDIYDEAERKLGPEVLTELLALVGYYDLLALMLKVFRVPVPEDGGSPFTG